MQELSQTARAYISGVILAAAATGIAVLALYPLPGPDQRWTWLTFGLLTALAATARIFRVSTNKSHDYDVSLALICTALLLLDYPLVVLSVVILYIPEWIKTRRSLYVQGFNIANFILAAVGARAVYLWAGDGTPFGYNALVAVAAAVAFLAFVNHAIAALFLSWARGIGLHDSSLFQSDSLLIDTALAGIGASIATLWRVDPWFALIGAYPLLLIYRSLDIPNLRHAARIDPKTGLYNVKHFAQVFREELQRAERTARPLAVIMADLDLLRNINNTYGHLAGDEVLKQVANIITKHIRAYDVAARFGGEEFAILLPETGPQRAMLVAERIRNEVSNKLFEVPTTIHPIRASLSLGVAAYPQHGAELNELVHQADLAVYWCKLNGRNMVCLADPSISVLLSQHSNDKPEEQASGGRQLASVLRLVHGTSAAPLEMHCPGQLVEESVGG